MSTFKPERDDTWGPADSVLRKPISVRTALIAVHAVVVIISVAIFSLRRPPSDQEPNTEWAGPPGAAPVPGLKLAAPVPGKVEDPSLPRPGYLPALPTVS